MVCWLSGNCDCTIVHEKLGVRTRDMSTIIKAVVYGYDYIFGLDFTVRHWKAMLISPIISQENDPFSDKSNENLVTFFSDFTDIHALSDLKAVISSTEIQ